MSANVYTHFLFTSILKNAVFSQRVLFSAYSTNSAAKMIELLNDWNEKRKWYFNRWNEGEWIASTSVIMKVECEIQWSTNGFFFRLLCVRSCTLSNCFHLLIRFFSPNQLFWIDLHFLSRRSHMLLCWYLAVERVQYKWYYFHSKTWVANALPTNDHWLYSIAFWRAYK